MSLNEAKEMNIKVLSKGAFIDNVDGQLFQIDTMTLSISRYALDKYWHVQVINDRMCYSTNEEWQDYLNRKEKLLNDWKLTIAKLAGIESTEGVTIVQVVSEIFSLVHIFKV